MEIVNNKIYIALCDDVTQEVESLSNILNNLDVPYTIETKYYSDCNALLYDIEHNEHIDIIFLDISMPDINGLILGKKIKRTLPDTVLIFHTNYSRYMAESFDSEPFNYLLKDDSIERKTNVIKRSIDKVLGLNKCFTIKQKSSIYTFKISDIFFVECLQKHIIYHFKNKKIEVRGKISTVYEELKPYGFLKVHQGYIVNMNQISKFDSQSVVLVSGDVVPVSIREKSNAVSEYIRFMEKRVV